MRLFLPSKYARGGFIYLPNRRKNFRGGGGGGVTAPTADPNLFAWFSADTSLTVTDTGSLKKVTAGDPIWTDRSGNSRQMKCDSGEEPQFYDGAYSSSGLPSGKPALHFASGLQMRSATGTANAPTTLSVYLLARLSSSMGWNGQRPFWVDTGSVRSCLDCFGGSGNLLNYSSGNTSITISNCPVDTWCVIMGIFNNPNSVVQANNLTGTTGDNGGSSGAGPWKLSASSPFTFLGEIGAFIMSSAANDSTTQAIHKNWLADYGGITI